MPRTSMLVLPPRVETWFLLWSVLIYLELLSDAIPLALLCLTILLFYVPVKLSAFESKSPYLL
jgi:hypothetical protein